MNINNEFDKVNIYSPSLHQDLYQKLIKCFSKYIPIHIIPKILDEEDINVVIDEIINDKNFQKPDTEIETYESIEELKFPQGYEDGGIIIIDDLNEKEMITSRVQAMFKRSRHNNLSIFINSHEHYELSKRTIRANRNVYHIFEPNNFRDKASMDMTFNEFKYLTSTCWNEKYQPFTIHMRKDKCQGRYRLGLNSIFVPNSSPFKIN